MRADANLDGTVDTLDFNVLAANFGASGTYWVRGDFNYDGTVDTLDFNSLAANFGLSAPTTTGSLVPEPTSIGVSAVSMLLLRSRRRKRCSQIRPSC
jgi:hypothetical protein